MNPCQDTHQFLRHDVVVAEGLEQGHKANLAASWGGTKAHISTSTLQLTLSKLINHSSQATDLSGRSLK